MNGCEHKFVCKIICASFLCVFFADKVSPIFFVSFMPRVASQVMVAMELCTNGALREALKLNISWPLKVKIYVLDFFFFLRIYIYIYST